MIIELLPVELKEFLGEIESLGFKLTLVGGVPRDFLLVHQLEDDLDFEMRCDHFISKVEWSSYYEKLKIFLTERKISYSSLPYLITRCHWGHFNLEFSSPRLEENIENDFTHHHFMANLDSNLSYEESFKRRDLSINAIGFELNFKKGSDKLIDPFEGVHDLEVDRVLKNLTDDFFHDSIRFLRLIRFQIKFDQFTIDQKLYAQMGQFNLTKLSRHHFNEEMGKSDPGKFLNLFSKWVSSFKLSIPLDFEIWLKYTFPDSLKSQIDILAFVFLQDKDDAQKVSRFFSLSEKKLRDLNSFFESYQFLKALSEDDFTSLLLLPESEALNHRILKELKNLEDKKEWRKPLQSYESTLLIKWEDWEAIKISKDELNKILAPLRSYYVYLKAIEGVYKK